MIKPVTFKLKSGNTVVLFIGNNNIAVHESQTGVTIKDGIHNNGGWEVQGTLQEVLKKINQSLMAL